MSEIELRGFLVLHENMHEAKRVCKWCGYSGENSTTHCSAGMRHEFIYLCDFSELTALRTQLAAEVERREAATKTEFVRVVKRIVRAE